MLVKNPDLYNLNVNSTPFLRDHRDFVEKYEWGCGDRPLHWMWYQICSELPVDAKLLEIGCYMGQVLSLWALIGRKLGRNFRVYGITPLSPEPDIHSAYKDINYREAIEKIHWRFDLSNPELFVGLSQDQTCIDKARNLGELDVLYIDGGHNYENVVADIQNYAPLVKKHGFIVTDDSLYNMDGSNTTGYLGFESVTNAVNEYLMNKGVAEISRVAHNRVFRKL
jgi:cephalosporin hydroxylase